MEIVTHFVSLNTLEQMSKRMFGKLVKAVVDLNRQVMCIDADMHSDQEEHLLETGSQQGDLWGINLYPQHYPKQEWIEFDSMINLRPSWGNFSRSVDDPHTQELIRELVSKRVCP